MYDVQMNCRGCVFANVDGGQQTGCHFKRLEKLGAEKKEDGFFHFDRVCNLSRPKEWLDSLSSGDDAHCTARKEVRPKVGVVITFNDNLEDLEATLDTAHDQISGSFKYVIVVNRKVEYNAEINDLFRKYFDINTPCYIVQLLVDADHQESLDHSFRFAKNGYIALVKAGYTFSYYFLYNIDVRINDQLKRLLVAKSDDRNKLLVSTPLWKLLNGNRPKMLEDGSVDSRDFYGKLADMPTTDPDSIVRWEDLFHETT